MVGYRYLLYTNILSDLIRHPAGVAARHIATVGMETVCTSLIVACELRYSALKKGSPILADRIEQLLAAIDVLPLETRVDATCAKIHTTLEKAGTPIGANDLLIAAHALSL